MKGIAVLFFTLLWVACSSTAPAEAGPGRRATKKDSANSAKPKTVLKSDRELLLDDKGIHEIIDTTPDPKLKDHPLVVRIRNSLAKEWVPDEVKGCKFLRPSGEFVWEDPNSDDLTQKSFILKDVAGLEYYGFRINFLAGKRKPSRVEKTRMDLFKEFVVTGVPARLITLKNAKGFLVLVNFEEPDDMSQIGANIQAFNPNCSMSVGYFVTKSEVAFEISKLLFPAMVKMAESIGRVN